MPTFQPFPRLPIELREQIWAATVEPRIVEVQRPWKSRETLGRLISSTPIPPILQACREARAQGLYTQVYFEVDVKNSRSGRASHLTESRYILLNYEVDIIDIGTSSFSHYKHVMSDIQQLRFERKNSDEYWYHVEARELRNFVKVKKVHVVCADGFWGWSGAINDNSHYWPCPDENVRFIDGDQIAIGRELEDICDRVRDMPFGNEGSSDQPL